MPEQDYEYSAFISYRHKDKYDDKDVKAAIWLQKTLESYKAPRAIPFFTKPFLIPENIQHKDYPRRFKRLFRDVTEMPVGDLSEQIEKALTKSKYLIVICSKRTPESPWIAKEIEFFHKLGRSKNIFALHIDGEPKTKEFFNEKTSQKIDIGELASFPDIITWRPEKVEGNTIYWQEKKDKLHDGSLYVTRSIREPLAASIAAVGRESLISKKKSARLRFMAAFFEKDLNAFTKRIEKMERQRRVSQAGFVTASLTGIVVSAGYLERNTVDPTFEECHQKMAHSNDPDVPYLLKKIPGQSLESMTETEIIAALHKCKIAFKNFKNPTKYQKFIRNISGSDLFHNYKKDENHLLYLIERAEEAITPSLEGQNND